jgi:hypothetical protein
LGAFLATIILDKSLNRAYSNCTFSPKDVIAKQRIYCAGLRITPFEVEDLIGWYYLISLITIS